jgi:hypothetical protein
LDILLTLSFNESAYYCQALLSGGIPASQEPLWQAPPHQGPFKFILSFCPFLPTSERFRKYFEAAGEHAPGRAVLVHGSKDKISTAEARDEVARLVRAEAGCTMVDMTFPGRLRSPPVRLSGCKASRKQNSASTSLRDQPTPGLSRASEACAQHIIQFRSFATRSAHIENHRRLELFILHHHLQSFLQSC